MRTLATLLLAGTATLVSFGAIAAPVCTSAPRSQWMPEQQMKDKLVKEGYVIDRFLVSGTCYEIYGKDTAGNKVEIYFDPTDGHIVKRRSKGA